MATKPQLEAAVNGYLAALGNVGAPQYNRAKIDSVYEAYVFTLTVDGFAIAGFAPSLRSIGCTTAPPSPFVVRGSPGQIYSNIADYGYAHLTNPVTGDAYELHVDVQCTGNAGVEHELDLSVVDATHAQNCRMLSRAPGAPRVYGATECKHYTLKPGLILARTYAGLADDMGQLCLRAFCCNLQAPKVATYLQRKSRASPGLELTPLFPAAEAAYRNHVANAGS